MPGKTIIPFQRERFDSDDLERLQDRIEETFEQLYSSEIINGRLIESASLTAGAPLEISHKLSRIPVGVILIGSAVQLDIWQPTAATVDSIWVDTSVTAIVNLWVF